MALIIGVGFFLKHAFDRDWITPPMRVSIGMVVGLALLYLAGRRQERYPVFAQGVLGAGISILYLSAYATFGFYDLIDQGWAFVLMASVTALAFERAVRFDSLAVALLGFTGGFLTPALLSGGETTSAASLFLYVLLLDAGLLALVTAKRSWWIVETLALMASYLTYAVWHAARFERGEAEVALLSITLIWLLFYAVDLVRLSGDDERPQEMVRLGALMNAVFFYAIAYNLIRVLDADLLGLATLSIAAAYFIPAAWLGPRSTPYVLKALALLALGTALQTDGLSTAVIWGAEALAILWVAGKLGLRYLKLSSLAFYALAATGLFFAEGALRFHPVDDHVLFLNVRSAAFLAVGAFAAIGAVIYEVGEDEDPVAPTFLHLAWALFSFVLLTVEINDAFRGTAPAGLGELFFERAVALASSWGILSLALMSLRRNMKLEPVAYLGLGILVLSTAALLTGALNFHPIETFTPVLNLRSAAFVMVGAIAAAGAFFWRGESSSAWEQALHAVWVLLLFAVVSIEINDAFRAAGSLTTEGRFTRSLAWAAAWAVLSILLLLAARALQTRIVAYAALGVLALAAVTSVLQGASFEPARSFRLVINTRTAALLVVIVATVLGGRLLLRFEWPEFESAPQLLYLGAAVSGLFLLSAETLDFFEARLASLPEGEVGRGSIIRSQQQLALSGVWLAYSSIALAVGIGWRRMAVRVGAMALLAITVFKVFLVDLSFLDTLYRTASFIALGVILLAASFAYQRYRTVLFPSQ